jgi:hypothetical protein
MLLIVKLSGRLISSHKRNDSTIYVTNTPTVGVSLGFYIFIDQGYSYPTEEHELGHSIQSKWLGPLYLIVVGIKSAIFNNLRDRLFHGSWTNAKRYKWYYTSWPEGPSERNDKWWDKYTADALMGIDRWGKK